MAKSKAAEKPAALPVKTEIVEEQFPEWFLPDEGEVAYEIGGDVATGSGLPFVSCANPKAGGGGGRTTWADLQAAGCGVGDAFASGGERDTPLRVAGVPLLLLRSVRIAYRIAADFRPEGTRRIADQQDAAPDERQALDALVLALTEDEPFLATYRERLSAAIGNRSVVVGVWADRLAKAPADKLPPWARLAGRIHSEPKVAKKSGQTYYPDRVALAPLSAPEVQRLGAWLAGPGATSGDTVREWADRYRAPAGTTPFPADGPEVPF